MKIKLKEKPSKGFVDTNPYNDITDRCHIKDCRPHSSMRICDTYKNKNIPKHVLQ